MVGILWAIILKHLQYIVNRQWLTTAADIWTTSKWNWGLGWTCTGQHCFPSITDFLWRNNLLRAWRTIVDGPVLGRCRKALIMNVSNGFHSPCFRVPSYGFERTTVLFLSLLSIMTSPGHKFTQRNISLRLLRVFCFLRVRTTPRARYNQHSQYRPKRAKVE